MLFGAYPFVHRLVETRCESRPRARQLDAQEKNDDEANRLQAACEAARNAVKSITFGRKNIRCRLMRRRGRETQAAMAHSQVVLPWTLLLWFNNKEVTVEACNRDHLTDAWQDISSMWGSGGVSLDCPTWMRVGKILQGPQMRWRCGPPATSIYPREPTLGSRHASRPSPTRVIHTTGQ